MNWWFTGSDASGSSVIVHNSCGGYYHGTIHNGVVTF